MNTPSSRSCAAACARFALIGFGSVALLLAQETKKAEEPAESSEPKKLEPFEVTGSRIKRTDLEGPSPIHVITHEEMDRVGAAGLTDIVREFPEVTSVDINEGSANGAARGTSALNLRALGTSNTLILVDGRRQAPNGINSGGVVFVDPNRFPIAMIERVEVLKDGASAVYGADATAGVINIITRKDFTGAEMSARYGNYFHTDGAEQTYSFLGGVAAGKAHVTVALTWATGRANAAIDEYFSADANHTERYRALDPVKYAPYLAQPTNLTSIYDTRSNAGPYATVSVPSPSVLAANGFSPAAIINPLTGVTSTFLPGTGGVPQGTIGSASTVASIPRGNNPARPTADQFVPRAFPAGDLSNAFNFQPFVWNVPETRRRGIDMSFAYDLAKWASLYSSVSFQRNESTIHLAPTPISTVADNLLVPAGNYYNPFGIPVAFTYRPLEFGSRVSDVVSDTLDFLAGAKGSWRQRFDWDCGFSTSQNKMTDRSVNSISRAALRAALAKTSPDAFNIFGGPAFKNDPATLASIRIAPVQSGDSRTTVVDGRVSTAELFSLPWGPVGSSALVEHRNETFNITNDPLGSTLNDIAGATRANDPTRSGRRVDSFAGELRLPLVREGRFAYARTVELSGAARFEKFSDGYTSGVTPFAGLRFRPTRDLLLRASYGKVFRAPSLPQLFGGVLVSQVSGLTDLRRPLALTNDPFDASTQLRTLTSGGNPKLLPEDGRTKQIGAVYDVPWSKLKGLSLEFTHGVIQQSNLITSGLGPTFIRQNELGSTSDLVFREPGNETYTNTTPTAIDILSGPNGLTTPIQPGQTVTVPGRLTSILDSAINLADQIVRYDDFGLSYRLPTKTLGRFTLTSNWSYYEFQAQHRFATDPYITNVGRSLPRYRGQSSVDWQLGPWAANVGLNYIHRYGDFVRDQYEARRYYTFSGGASYAFRKPSFFGDTLVAVGLENLFNRAPSLNPATSGYDQTLVARPGGRFAFVSVRHTL